MLCGNNKEVVQPVVTPSTSVNDNNAAMDCQDVIKEETKNKGDAKEMFFTNGGIEKFEDKTNLRRTISLFNEAEIISISDSSEDDHVFDNINSVDVPVLKSDEIIPIGLINKDIKQICAGSKQHEQSYLSPTKQNPSLSVSPVFFSPSNQNTSKTSPCNPNRSTRCIIIPKLSKPPKPSSPKSLAESKLPSTQVNTSLNMNNQQPVKRELPDDDCPIPYKQVIGKKQEENKED
ncbi:hypothetical protein QTN25_001223 [Entamoeba marina]